MSDHKPPRPFFLRQGLADLFALYYQPDLDGKQAILLAPPFGDEMNKSRRMLCLQAQRFRQQGYTVLMVDLSGTGDSSGEFGDSSWESWRDNLHYAWNWLNQEKGIPHIHFWGVRLGSLLALDAAACFKLPVASFVFWQPMINGERFVTQLMRLKLAEQFARGKSETVKSLRGRSAAGETLEIGGYSISSDMVATLAQLQAAKLKPAPGTPVAWLECSTAEPPELLPPSRKLIDQWQTNGDVVVATCIKGPSFWNSVEIEEVPELVEQTGLLFTEANNDST